MYNITLMNLFLIVILFSSCVQGEINLTIDNVPFVPLDLYLREHNRSPEVTFEFRVSEPIIDPSHVDLHGGDIYHDIGEPLNPHDFSASQNLNFLSPHIDANHIDPIELAEKHEGDIQLTLNDQGQLANAAFDTSQLWPNAVIPYIIGTGFSSSERAIIALAVRAFEENTCIKIVPKMPGDRSGDYVHVVRGTGCSSGVGRQGGAQTLSLGHGCLYKGIVVHEFMHAAGFWHEQSRPDRDNYVNIHWQNIQHGLETNFRKFEGHQLDILSEPYDLGSVMHYGKYAFSRRRNISPTITVKFGDDAQMGQRQGLSRLDISKLNKLYRCDSVHPSKPIVTTVAPPTATTCVDFSQNCQWWASRGECIRNPHYMLNHCKKSCQQCSGGSCLDLNHKCHFWSEKGECSKNPSYMLEYCKVSCQLCSPECSDENVLCPSWASLDECSKNPNYMLVSCRKSCDVC